MNRIAERDIRRVIAQALGERAKLVTLTANAASTTITDARIRFDSFIGFQPTTANAAAELGAGTLYVDDSGRVNGSVTITHANNAQTDRTFKVLIG